MAPTPGLHGLASEQPERLRWKVRLGAPVLAFGLAAVLVVGLPGAAGAQRPIDRLQHLVVIYQENHSFDNYFGTFPGADGLANAFDFSQQPPSIGTK